jgi:hypothetical protein
MSQKGVVNPWANQKKKGAADSVQERLAGKAREGKTPVSLQGRLYSILVTLPVRFQESKDADVAARHVMGEFLQKSQNTPLAQLLLQQKVSVKESDLIGPKVTFEFGPVQLHAAASSSDLNLALAFGIDRLALALTEGRVRNKSLENLMKEHFLEVLRNV